MKIGFPEKLLPLFEPSRYKSVRGGRDGGKSWGVAILLLEMGAREKHFVVCCRETMDSIRDSCYRLLLEQIERLKMQDQWEVGASTEPRAIRHKWTGTEFVFRGLKNPDAMKSLEGATIAWIEEAQGVSEESWRKLTPTVRQKNSEIWLTWNPELDSDPTWDRFVLRPPPGMIEILMNFTDNPWASEALIAEREQMRIEQPDEYTHVYLGIPRSNVQGAVFGDEMKRVDLEQRIGPVAYDPSQPVHTFWDVGMDTTAIWFAQGVALQIRVIDYYENKGKGIDHYARALQERGYVYGRHWLPWDVGVQAAPAGMGAGKSLESILRGYGYDVRSSPRWSNTQVAINSARLFFPRCWFDGTRCEAGIRGLRRYQWGDPPASGATTRQPLHDWASHPAAAFQYMAGNFAAPIPKEPAKPSPGPYRAPVYSPFG